MERNPYQAPSAPLESPESRGAIRGRTYGLLFSGLFVVLSIAMAIGLQQLHGSAPPLSAALNNLGLAAIVTGLVAYKRHGRLFDKSERIDAAKYACGVIFLWESGAAALQLAQLEHPRAGLLAGVAAALLVELAVVWGLFWAIQAYGARHLAGNKPAA